MKINTKSIVYGTMILTIANTSVRVLGFIYRILISRLIGPQGMGLVQMVYPVYMIALTFSISGIPVAVSKLVSEYKVKNDIKGMKRVVITALLLVTFISLLISVITLTNLDFISNSILKDGRTKGILFIILPCIIVVGLACVFKGFFYGIKEIHPPAFAGIIEQLVRMSVALSLLYLFNPKDYAQAGALVAVGMVIGEMASLLFLHYRYNSVKNMGVNSSISAKYYKVFRSIITIAAPITLTRIASSFINGANAVLIPQRLIAGGMSNEEAVGLFGIASGMVMPLLFLPFTITNALSVVIIPNLSERMVLKDWNDIRQKIYKTFYVTCLTAFPSMALLTSLGDPIGNVLYAQPLVGQLLLPLSFSLVFHALQHTSSGILNGLGKQNKGAIHFFLGSIVQLITTYFLVADPRFGIYGFVISFFTGSVIISLLNIKTILKFTNLEFPLIKLIIKPGLAALVSGLTTRLLYTLVLKTEVISWIASLINLILLALIGLAVFFVCLYLLGGLPTGYLNTIRTKVIKRTR